jgi:hypothetical protein
MVNSQSNSFFTLKAKRWRGGTQMMLKLIFLLASVYLGDARAESETEGLAHLDNIFKRSKGINDLSLNPKMYRSESFYYEL